MQPERLDNVTVSVLPPGPDKSGAQVIWSKDYCECNRRSKDHSENKCVRVPEYVVKRHGTTLRVCDMCLVEGDVIQ